MKWEVSVVPKVAGASGSSFTVNADNWMEALKQGFDRVGGKDYKIKIISCQIQEDHTVCIHDLTTQSVFYVKSVEGPSALPPVPGPEGESFLESKRSAQKEEKVEAVSFLEERRDLPPAPPALPQHRIFYEKDENPGPGSSMVYRERVISVAPGTPRAAVTDLVQHYFETLHREISGIQGSRCINLAVYDHEFKGNPKGLSLAALSWQDWKSQAPVIVYPKDESNAVAAGQGPYPVQPAQAQAQVQPQPAAPPPPAQPQQAWAPVAPQPQPRPQAKTPPPVPAAAYAQTRERRRSSEMVLDELDPNRALAEAFEELQDLFLTQTQDEAAEFVLNIATKKVTVEAGTIFLADINTRKMAFAAVKGPNAEALKGQNLLMTKGIVGFAAREGAAIAVADVAKDPRFCSDFDQTGGFVTKSVLCAPIQFEGRTFGAIELVNKKKGDMFTQGEINIVSYLASQLAEFIATSLPSAEPDFLDEDRAQQAKVKQPVTIKKVKPKGKKPGR
jgi:putative methionine-R-sulfoxide reductase with GAF domain